MTVWLRSFTFLMRLFYVLVFEMCLYQQSEYKIGGFFVVVFNIDRLGLIMQSDRGRSNVNLDIFWNITAQLKRICRNCTWNWVLHYDTQSYLELCGLATQNDLPLLWLYHFGLVFTQYLYSCFLKINLSAFGPLKSCPCQLFLNQFKTYVLPNHSDCIL
jgi:hypothetical protein